MGTDIYLFEKKNDGDYKAYIRASIWMREENGVLRQLFPSEFWEGETLQFDFHDEKLPELFASVMHNYVSNDSEVSVEVCGKEYEVMYAFMKALKKVAEEAGAETSSPDALNDDDRKEWATTVKEFFRIGHDLQKKMGEKPFVGISW